MSNAVLADRESEGRLRLWRRLSVVLLAAYWAGIFAGTHNPTPPHTPFGNADKWMHLSAYFGLALIVSIVVALRRPVSLLLAGGILLLLAGYGALDELTQPFVGRDCDLFDWYADVTGIVAGLLLFQVGWFAWRRWDDAQA